MSPNGVEEAFVKIGRLLAKIGRQEPSKSFCFRCIAEKAVVAEMQVKQFFVQKRWIVIPIEGDCGNCDQKALSVYRHLS